MPTEVKPKATDDPHDFVVIPSDQVRVAPSDAEISDLLRAAARHHSEASVRAARDPSMPAVDTTFRATAVNDGVPARKASVGRRAMRAIAALLLTLGIGAAALGWQTFGYAAKKALFIWGPKWAIVASLPLDKLGLGAKSPPSDEPASEAPEQQTAVSTQNASDSSVPVNAAVPTATPSSDTVQQLQSMARDLANANQEVEALKAGIAELKASQQQMSRDLAKISEQAAKAKMASTAPRPPAAHRPAPVYSSASTYAPAATPAAPPPAYRPASSYPTTQAAAGPAAQPYVPPPPMQLQPQTESGSGPAPRPPMPVQ